VCNGEKLRNLNFMKRLWPDAANSGMMQRKGAVQGPFEDCTHQIVRGCQQRFGWMGRHTPSGSRVATRHVAPLVNTLFKPIGFVGVNNKKSLGQKCPTHLDSQVLETFATSLFTITTTYSPANGSNKEAPPLQHGHKHTGIHSK
jgi:hypothetical protein